MAARHTAYLAFTLVAAHVCIAQSAGSSVPTFETRANLVTVDVVVTDRAGNSAAGLTAADLAVTDNGKAQTINSFEAHTAKAVASAIRTQTPPELPPGVFSNAEAASINAPVLNVLLIDALNTPLTDQTFLHQQLAQFLHAPSPGPLAIFGLTSHLIALQGFTADPRLLRSAVERMGSRLSSARGDNVSTGSDTRASDLMETSLGGQDREIAAAAARLRELEAITEVQQDRMRQHETLDALDALASYLATLPGRKNLIWFSGAFPLDVLPDARLQGAHEFRNAGSDILDQLRETSTLLTRAHVALYPVDARGLFNVPSYDPGARIMMNPESFTRDLQTSNQQVADQHEIMRTMAEETGGHAYVNTNGLARAISQAITVGSTFYSIAYTPTPADPRQSLHRIRIALAGRFAGTRLNLSYRRSYIAAPALMLTGTGGRRALTIGGETLALPLDENALRLAMMHGAPEIGAIAFTAKVQPVAASGTQGPDARTRVNAASARGPWRTYTVTFTLPVIALLTAGPDGNLAGTAQFAVHCYNSDGQLMTSTSDAVRMSLPAAASPQMQDAKSPFEQRISVPQGGRPGDLFLRMGVENLATGAVGSLEVPLTAVNNLAPTPLSATLPPARAVARP